MFEKADQYYIKKRNLNPNFKFDQGQKQTKIKISDFELSREMRDRENMRD